MEGLDMCAYCEKHIEIFELEKKVHNLQIVIVILFANVLLLGSLLIINTLNLF